MDRQRRELEEQRDETQETRQDYMVKLMQYGFRIEDPDIRKLNEDRDERDDLEPDEGP